MHPDAIKLVTQYANGLAAFNRTKLDVEYVEQFIQAKGLAPNSDGSPPASLGVDGGTIGGNSSTLNYADYALSQVALSMLVAALTQEAAPGVTVEDALLRFAAV